MEANKKDREILSLLQKNARMSNVEIAKKVGLTEGAVRSRIRKLIRQGTIKRFTVELAGAPTLYAVVMLKSKRDTKKMMSAVSSLSIHKDAYEIAGSYDGCIILQGFSMDEIDGKIDRLRKLKSLEDTRTFISFRKW
ncbi:winged helix-turn-helix transcriptional regulator [Candidatus Micrarchaeota archaeon]|nr:winged helix-turn-helix transcriptional regulator [Candidatus Micrarchaeota archaeon]